MPKRSAGLLLYRRSRGEIEVLLVHPGGPFWRNKDEGAWSIPKGLCEEGEDTLTAASREFEEETGHRPIGEPVALGEFKQPGGKLILAYAVEGDFDPAKLRSNLFSIEWPPRSGRSSEFPEVDRARWFAPDEAGTKLVRGQVPILEALLERLGA
jgi:predicted NUDIX family NTP pyrophosphohydrolase